MTKDEMKNKYSAFIAEISEIMGLGKPIDILKLCKTTDLFFRPLEKRIEELEKENAELKEKLKPENCLKLLAKDGYVSFTSDQLTKAKELIEELSKSLYLAKGIIRDLIDETVDFKESKDRATFCCAQAKFDAYKKAEQFISEVEK